MIDESDYSNGKPAQKFEIPLLQVSIGTWEDIQQMTIQQIGLSKKSPDQMIWPNEDAGVRESNKAPGKYKLNGSRSKELEYPTPISLHACNFQECGKIAIRHKKCDVCVHFTAAKNTNKVTGRCIRSNASPSPLENLNEGNNVIPSCNLVIWNWGRKELQE